MRKPNRSIAKPCFVPSAGSGLPPRYHDMIWSGCWYYHQPGRRYPMIETLQPLRATSLKEVFIQRFEELIISGRVHGTEATV